MRRGDLWWINLEQVVGAESSTLRPGVVVSNDGASDMLTAVDVNFRAIDVGRP